MKKLICLLLAAVLALSLAACGGAPAPETTVPTETAGETAPGTTAAPTTHTVVDHLDNAVEVPYEVNRIVVCDIYPMPSVLTVFFDSAEKIVGMPAPSMTAAANGLLGQLYPQILKAETGFIDGSTINMEELLKLQPDVVFYSASQPQEGEQLRNAGIPALAVSVNKWQYNAIETLNNWIDLLSQVFPENDKTQVVREYSDKMYDLVQQRVSTLDEADRQRVFFLFQYTDTNMLTSGKQFFGQWWADAIGAVNVAQELEKDNSVAVNMEQVYAWNPSLIFVTNFTKFGPEDLYNNTVGTYDWSAVDAVKNHQVYKMPLGMYRSYTPGVDTPVTLLWLAKSAYPQLFNDIDLIAETKAYYQEVFGIALTDQQAESIFAPPAEAGTGF